MAANESEPVVAALRKHLDLDEPIADVGVAQFGLRNAIFVLGDTFLEVVSPARPGTAAGRFLTRRGEGGYMAIFQVPALEAARRRATRMGIRVVWQSDEEDIQESHLHPVDMGGPLVEMARPLPAESWPPAGPEWTGHAGRLHPGRVAGITISSPEVEMVATRWSTVLGVTRTASTLALDDGSFVAFVAGPAQPALTQITVELPGRGCREGSAVDICGVRINVKAPTMKGIHSDTRSYI